MHGPATTRHICTSRYTCTYDVHRLQCHHFQLSSSPHPCLTPRGHNLGVCLAQFILPRRTLENGASHVAANSLADEGRVTGARIQRYQRGNGVVPHTLETVSVGKHSSYMY